MYALQILLDGMHQRNFVPRKKTAICVTFGACRGLIFSCHCGCSLARCLNLVHGSVTRRTRWRIRITRFRSEAVNALLKFLRFSRVTFRTFFRLWSCRHADFMHVAVAGSASQFAERRVDARRLFRVAGCALHLGNSRRVREILDGRVTVLASQNAMNARRMLIRADGDVFPFFGFHSYLAVADEAGFI